MHVMKVYPRRRQEKAPNPQVNQTFPLEGMFCKLDAKGLYRRAVIALVLSSRLSLEGVNEKTN